MPPTSPSQSILRRKWRLILPLLAVGIVALILFAEPPMADDRNVSSEAGNLRVLTVAKGLDHPWGLAFLPDGDMLVTEKPGTLRRVSKDGKVSEPLSGVPEVVAVKQGGLLDVAIDPDFKSNRLVYLSYSEPGEGGSATAAARGKLGDKGLEDIEVIFRQTPRVDNGLHFGSRFAFAPDGTLFITLGERFQFDPAQDLSNTLGKIVRINPDGSIPKDNPFAGKEGARGDIWSYGHRNILSAVFDASGRLWVFEMGPRGGDELNLVEPGHNYGWPVVSNGDNYAGPMIPDHPTRKEFQAPVRSWTPVISPSGAVLYNGTLFDGWRGSVIIGGLSSQALVRIALDGQRVAIEERIDMKRRIRDLIQTPDGAILVIVDDRNGDLLRLTPAATRAEQRAR